MQMLQLIGSSCIALLPPELVGAAQAHRGFERLEEGSRPLFTQHAADAVAYALVRTSCNLQTCRKGQLEHAVSHA